MKLPYKIIIGVAGIAAAIAWSVQGVDLKNVLMILSEMNRTLSVGVLILTTVNLVIRSVVWKFIVSPIKPVPLRYAISSYLIGVFSNLFLPLKLGDVAQGYSLGRRQDMSKISVVSAVLIQRVFEVTSLLLIMSTIGALFSFPLLFQKQTLILGVLILCGICILLLLFRNREKVVLSIESIVEKFSPSAAKTISKSMDLFLTGTTAIHNLPDVLKIMIFSFLSWIVQILMVWFTAIALNISIDFLASSVVLLIINLGLTIPLAPGNIGTFQFFSIIALSLFSVSKSKALAFAIIFQVIQAIPVIFAGGFSLFNEYLNGTRKSQGEIQNNKHSTSAFYSRNTEI